MAAKSKSEKQCVCLVLSRFRSFLASKVPNNWLKYLFFPLAVSKMQNFMLISSKVSKVYQKCIFKK
jgi:hypothetical protein